MRIMIAHDDIQLRRLIDAIAAIDARPETKRRRMTALRDALEIERKSLLRADPQLRRARSAVGQPGPALRPVV